MGSNHWISKLCFSDLVAELYEDKRLGKNVVITTDQKILIYQTIFRMLSEISLSKASDLITRDMNIFKMRENLKIFEGKKMTIEKLYFEGVKKPLIELTFSELLVLLNVYQSASLNISVYLTQIDDELSRIYKRVYAKKSDFKKLNEMVNIREKTDTLRQFSSSNYIKMKQLVESLTCKRQIDKKLEVMLLDTLKTDLYFRNDEKERIGSARSIGNILFYEEDIYSLYERYTHYQESKPLIIKNINRYK